MATLYIVATPIGNLEDITLRAITVLSNVDLILAEDTRVTQRLLARYNIKKEIMSYHEHSTLKKIDSVINLLKNNKNMALVSDAGTPGINDPGNFLIKKVLEVLPDTKIVPIPGANAAIAALSISGFPSDQFTYLGFPPNKKGRQRFFKNALQIDFTVVFYESKYRILKTLNEIKAILQNPDQRRHIMVAREMTKQFETIYRGTISEVLHELEMHKHNLLGEFVVVVGPKLKV